MDKDSRKELKVSAIENGTVIDHIPSRSLFQVVRILNLEKYESQILIGMNLDSLKYGRKGILKISNKFFRNDEINKIALAAPTATMIVIRDFQVAEKRAVEIPEEVNKIVKCFNPNCITNHEKITTRFNVIDKEKLRLQCHYCEKITAKDNMVFI
jgi:aspartate carbamoyltransferase regulatory subunit